MAVQTNDEIKGTEKEFLDLFNHLCYSRTAWQVWSDLMSAMACTIANVFETNPKRKADREKEYERCIKELGGDVHFLMVNSTGGRETMESAKEYLEGQDYTFPVYYDTDYDASATYGVYALPTTYFVDAEGYLVAYASGALDEDTLRRGIDMIHGE